MRAGLSRASASFCRRHAQGAPSTSFERAWRFTFVSTNTDVPCAPHHQEAAAEHEEEDALASAFSGMGLSPPNLPRSLSQVHRTCPHHLAKHLAFFKSTGIHADGFSKIVSMYPQALNLDPDTELKVSIALLESAIGKILVSECILSWPSLLGVGSSPKEVGLGPESVQQSSSLQVLGMSSRVLGCPQRAVPSGFSEKELSSPHQTSSMQESGLLQQVFSRKIDILLKCGFKKNTKLLAKALYCSLHKSKQDIDAVIQALMSLGLSRNHASKLIKLQPAILQQKPSEITSKLDYILNTLCLSFEDLFKYSSFMMYNLDSHIRPRYLMHGWLKSKRLLRRNFKLDYIMSMSEKQFVCKFVECHEDGLNMYHGFTGNAK